MKDKINILAVDDSEDILFAISAICEYQGWGVLTARDAVEGVELFKKHKPDIVLMDFHMPKVDGIQAVGMLREISKYTPIIVLTVEERQEIADKFIKAGASDFAIKPLKAPDLISRINVHLKMLQGINEDSALDNEYIKGISRETLEIIVKYMEKAGGQTTISSISNDTGLAYQTVHRYIQHLVDNKRVEVSLSYGKQGRPTQKYRYTG